MDGQWCLSPESSRLRSQVLKVSYQQDRRKLRGGVPVRFPCSDVGLLFGNMEVPYGFFEGDYSHKNRGFKFRTLYL